MRPRALSARILRFIAANVRRGRLRLGMTQEKLAEAAGLSAVHVQRIERAEVDLRISAFVALAGALDVRPGSLLRPAEPLDRPPGRPRKVGAGARRAGSTRPARAGAK